MTQMNFEAFMARMLRPSYIWRMASGKDRGEDSGYERGARTSMAKARREIDDLVLQRALVIQDERRCGAIGNEPSTGGTVRCEYPRGHDPVPGRRGTAGGLVMHDTEWDHAAPSKGLWWMNRQPEEAMA